MLKGLLECKLPAKLIIIADEEDVIGQDVFITALKHHSYDDTTKEIKLICYENPPELYLPLINNDKIVVYNYFSDACGWNNSSAPKSDLSIFISNPTNLSETVFFIDSLSFLNSYHGYFSMYRTLSVLKQVAKKVVCLAHCDLFDPEQVEELKFLVTAFISLKQVSSVQNSVEKICEVMYKKSGGKVIKHEEILSISEDGKINSRIKHSVASVSSHVKEDMENLTTFRLGLQMTENERKARNELVLPYVKTKQGEIFYQPEPDEFEDDPDDDLDI